jgi:phospholipid-transporting ATPase
MNKNETNRKLYQFELDNNSANKNHRTNAVSTTKYNIITFLPKALLFQFFRLANVYFLVIAIIQSIRIISPLSPATAVAPLAVVLSVSLIREAIEDYMRYRFDKALNSEVVTVFRNRKWIETRSDSLHVGEIVMIKEDTPFPADLVILDSSLPEGISYIETGTLDGEKAPKLKTAVRDTAGLFSDSGEYKSNFTLKGSCIANPPDQNLYFLQANLTIKYGDGETIEWEKTLPADAKQLLLKGAILRNTKWIVGFVVYAGHNTKLIKNSGQSRVKYSKIETLMSRLLVAILVLQMCFCIICAGLNSVYYFKFVQRNPYLPGPLNGPFTDSLISYFSYLLLLNTMIPISLIISLELTKIAQGFFMAWDADMYSFVRKVFVKPGSISLNEELGQINFIFSDKTGTLTCNKMLLKYVVIGDVCYEYGTSSEVKGKSDMQKYGDGFFQQYAGKTSITADKTKFQGFVIKSEKNSNVRLNLENEANVIEEFWKALSICHECSINEKDGKEVYSGESPDEIELVRASAVQGFVNKKSEKNSIRKLTIAGEVREFEILKTFEFNSTRKRSSVIVRDGGVIKLYTKGADNIITASLHPENRKDIHEQIKTYVNDFSLQGYRCLYIGMKVFDQKEYDDFAEELEKANLDLENKEVESEKVTQRIENGIHLLGSTIVEDKLQDRVPETIRDLRLAGIKIWMITGDKIDTAFNIGLSCNLISYDLENFKIEGEKGVLLDTLITKFDEFRMKHNGLPKLPPYSVLIDAVALDNIINPKRVCNRICCTEKCGNSVCDHKKECKNECVDICTRSKLEFSSIAYGAATIICSRVNAEQKAQVVRLIKNYDTTAITLSIGDGNNDVKMINEAHIGNNLSNVRYRYIW